MSTYCDFNPKLFRPFTSMKVKVEPSLSDDWEIINEQYNRIGGMGVYSKKLGIIIQDIDLRRFLRFCKEQNLTIVGNFLQGTFIVGNNRSIYTQSMFNEWKSKFDKRTAVIIPPKDYKIGHRYKTPCGAEVVYLGSRYVSKITEIGSNKALKINKVRKVHYIDYAWKFATVLKQKFSVDLGQELTEEECNNKLTQYYELALHYVCFSETIVKDPKYGIIDIKFDLVPDSFNYPLIVSLADTLYIGSTAGVSMRGDGKTVLDRYRVIDHNLYLTAPKESRWSYDSSDYKPVDAQFYRVGLV